MKKEPGFTLLEILLVIAIISILVVVAIPRFKPNQEHANIRQAANQFKNDLLFLRQLAKTEEADQTVYIFNQGRYVINPSDLDNPGASGNDIKVLPSGVVFLKVDDQDVPPGSQFTFDRQGKLDEQIVITLQRSGAEGGSQQDATITVAKTGLVEVTYP